MQRILSEPLLDLLSSLDYRYVLARQNAVLGEDADTCITLTPVKSEPVHYQLAGGYDAYYKIGAELMEMAAGAGKTIMVVDVGEVTLNQVVESYLNDKNEKNLDFG